MASQTDRRDLVLAIGPFEEPNAAVAAAAHRAGAQGVVDLGRDAAAARAALAVLARRRDRAFGVRVPCGCPLVPAELPDGADVVVLAADAPWAVSDVGPGRRVLAEVGSLAEARAARDAGADGLIAVGHEAGGRVGGTTTFVLLQQLTADPGLRLPVWAKGGIGPHTAAAAVAGGAEGVVLDTQLALLAECAAALPDPVAAALRAMDGGETALLDGHRVFTRPGLPLRELADTAAASGGIATAFGARGLDRQLLPVGQDGALARRFAERYGTTGRAVAAVRTAIAESIEAAVRLRALAPAAGDEPRGSSAVRRPRLPVVQGPMTRVSDRAEFAEAVATGDGLPFLALALLDGDAVRALLAETAARLGDKPWGVGLLGFAPPELRERQLAAVAEVRPPYALIAGGRPDQAAPLEAAGIATYLHVPSPGLLEQFLRAGARRFVFEGLECGGHVGPRASFPLWETQIDALLRHARKHGAADLDVLFAGGIHDARSAAMVAAASAPLTERGARVGVLMGTAYLFTDEAVTAGAILPGFRDAAVECGETVLLQTAPGHATRCADTPFVTAFAAARADLEARGVPATDMWAELEGLNLGRLRIASKGVRRAGSDLVRVDDATQRRDGMFMLGQTAALRGATTDIAALHREVTDGAVEFLASRAAGLGLGAAEGSAAEPLDVAIVGMECVFPGAADAAGFWRTVVGGADAVSEVPRERWDHDLYYDPDAVRDPHGRTPSKWGGFVPRIPFDPTAYGIPPASLGSIEPAQLLALHVAARALHDAGYGDGREFDRSRTAVVFGAEAGTDLAGAYGFRSLYPAYFGALPPDLDAELPMPTEDSFPGVLANVIAGRIANRLDLGGVNYTVDAACAASLAALDLACKELVQGGADMVLCGGVDTHNGINDYLMFASVHALSPSGRCAAFDGAADGIALGEGAACLVLKRLADAERDGDRVYAVVKAVGGASDGRSLGLTAPRPEGQRRALERAYANAGVSPASVGLVEAHGTGTVVGDRTELETLTAVFAEAGAAPGSCALGSVKSQIGHTKCAAGLAGLIKASLAVHHGVRPPTLHVKRPNTAWDAETSPFSFDARSRPWTEADPARRVAGVSAFGFGGTNFHAVLAGHAGPVPVDDPDLLGSAAVAEWPAELFCFAGASREDAEAALAKVAASADAAGPRSLRGLAAFAADLLPAGAPVWIALVAGDVDDLRVKLARARDGAEDPRGEIFRRHTDEDGPGKVAFLYPGQGSQRPGMAADLFVAFPGLRAVLGEAPESCVAAMFPPAAFTAEDRDAAHRRITETRTAQPALGVASVAVTRLLDRLGVRPELAAGHSYGELVALWAAGLYDSAALLRLSAARGEAIVAATGDDPGAMAAVAAGADRVAEVVGAGSDGALALPGLVVANLNTPKQTVVSGPTASVDAAVALLEDAGISVRRLPVACAFHSPLIAGAAETLARVVDEVEFAAASFPVWSNTSAEPYPPDAEAVRRLLARQVAAPVRFVDEIEAMYAAGARVFVEAGPGRALTGMVGAILGDRPHTAVACDVAGEPGIRRLLTACAELAVRGVPVAVRELTRGRVTPADVEPGRRPGWVVDGQLVRTADGEPVAGGLRPARGSRVAEPVPMRGADPAFGHAAGPGRELGAHPRGGPDARGPGDRFDPLTGGTAPYPGSPRLAPGPAVTAATEASGDANPLGPGGSYPASPLVPPVSLSLPIPSESVLAGRYPEFADPRENAVLAYLAGTRELIAAQRDVLLGFLGAPPMTSPVPQPAVWGGATPMTPVGAVQPVYSETAAPMAYAEASAPTAYAAEPEPVWEVPAESAVVAPGPVSAPAAPAAPAAPSRALPSTDDVLEAVLDIVGTRTGYPREMLDTDLDLEADLSVDSIKRTEIIGELAMRLDLLDEALVERLARVKTISGIVEGLVAHAREVVGGSASSRSDDPTFDGGPHSNQVPDAGGGARTVVHSLDQSSADVHGSGLSGALATGSAFDAGSGHAPSPALAAGTGPVPDANPARTPEPLALAPQPPTRHTVDLVAFPSPAHDPAYVDAALAGRSVLLVADPHGVALALAALLERRGARVRIAEPGVTLGDVPDVLVHLGALRAEDVPVVLDDFPLLRDALRGGVRTLLAATGFGGAFGRDAAARAAGAAGLGLAGFARTAAREYPDTAVRVVDLDPKAEPAHLAEQLLPLLAEPPAGPDGHVVVGLDTGTRLRRVLDARPTPTDPGEPSGTRPLGPGSVVLLTGGARGITAQAALGFARAYGCHIELVGRTPAPGPEDPATAAAPDRTALRAALAAARFGKPAEIETAVSGILAGREVAATLAELGAHAASVRLHATDVRDPAALHAVVADVYARHGRLDGIVHGAGVLDDRLLADKSHDAFARVFTTKVAAAHTLADAVRGRPDGTGLPAFLALFGSVAGVFGNRGQSDYAAANDALDTLACRWHRAAADGAPDAVAERVVSVDWGPWAASGGGMVTAELERHYQRLGMPLIDPDAGVAALLAELASGSTAPHVAYLCPPPAGDHR
ncbi:hypothetical protein GCM10023205_34150 [Yinghuangia aomiensis]|uniref:Ketosynthase family 3 (KS3) domain-containing protein n=1 Tax=Yinghuangia aomiensis TaxID=676205 RepID=A0ABP9HBJ4_9ACTN